MSKRTIETYDFEGATRQCGRIVNAPDDPEFRFDNGLSKEQEIRRLARIDRQFAAMLGFDDWLAIRESEATR